MRTFKICYSYHAVYYIPTTYLFNNWKPVPFAPPSFILHLLPPPPLTINMFSVFMSLVLLFFLSFFFFKDSHISKIITILVFLCLASFTQHNALKVHPHCSKWQDFILLITNNIIFYICSTLPLSIHLLMNT